MDIVDKVFEKLNLDYDADKERLHAARMRQKESLVRRKVRLEVFGAIVAVVTVGVGLAFWLPHLGGMTTAESDIAVVFREDEQPIEQIVEIVREKTEEASDNSASDEAEQNETNTNVDLDTKANSTVNNEATAVVNSAKRAIRQKATNSSQPTTRTETIVHIIDGGEQVDQGANNCTPVESGSTGVVLWCADGVGVNVETATGSDSAPTTPEDDEADEPQESEEQEDTED